MLEWFCENQYLVFFYIIKTKVFTFELTPCNQRQSIDNWSYPVWKPFTQSTCNASANFVLQNTILKIACIKNFAQPGTDSAKRFSQHPRVQISQVQQSMKYKNGCCNKNISWASWRIVRLEHCSFTASQALNRPFLIVVQGKLQWIGGIFWNVRYCHWNYGDFPRVL